VIEWFADFHPPDYARTGNLATRTVIVPAGPILQHHSDPPEAFPHNEEPQLRKLGLHTTLKKGVPTLDTPQTVCENGKKLTGEQARLLKLMGIKMVEFKVVLRARWSAASGEVVDVDTSSEVPADGAADDGEEEDMDE
jgi:mRNA turnover protein 4